MDLLKDAHVTPVRGGTGFRILFKKERSHIQITGDKASHIHQYESKYTTTKTTVGTSRRKERNSRGSEVFQFPQLDDKPVVAKVKIQVHKCK